MALYKSGEDLKILPYMGMAATVNSEIFASVLFSRNFAYAKFREDKPSRNGEITLSFTDIGKSCPSGEFLTSQICLFARFAKIKFSRKFANLQCILGSRYIGIFRGCFFGINLTLSYPVTAKNMLNSIDVCPI